jgi:threonine/homoserine/homoserine lactone efflux protein
MVKILHFIITGMALATWNPFKYLIGTDSLTTKTPLEYTVGDWFKIALLALLPIVVGVFLLFYFGVFGKKKTTYRRKRRTTSVMSRVRRSLPSAKSAMARKMARLRSLRRKKRVSKTKK